MSRHPILSVGPAAEIDQLASFGTERPPGIVSPLDRLGTRWTFRHRAKVRRKKIKVKAGADRTEKRFRNAAQCCRAAATLGKVGLPMFGATLSGLRWRVLNLIPRVAEAATLGCICSTALRLTWLAA